ncbi:MAG: pyrroloquinoline quinone precursor peptide PqqA [Gammaproteobacteria bacterium]|nr:pyrroloquinoline quinone precursor peptide PqqA [Gammaproteobacteria bacterium]MBU1725623.1 pyrroloquinoline quinone precursor peptide PqqA [Gammaproteobacteria bacterium]MBU2004025.1 pyrroloquinoline quinone precursor peptide PqqA [Gammaproteobacteria bacterium]
MAHNENSENLLIQEELSSMKKSMKWVKPAFNEMRYGFEINLYIMNR